MILLLDIGNTHTHVGIGDRDRVLSHVNLPTPAWFQNRIGPLLAKQSHGLVLEGAVICSVVPRATKAAVRLIAARYGLAALQLGPETLAGIGIEYPKPETIGPDRLANAVAVAHHFGAPAVVVDFGTAVTFDVVDAKRNYVGGIIAPGLSAMTSYLHEKTALLPAIEIRETTAVIGKNTEEAMLIGAVHGYRGLIRGLLGELKQTLKARRLPIVATGGYAEIIAAGMPEITAVEPLLTLEGLRLTWQAVGSPAPGARPRRRARVQTGS